jgi:autotransporter-associated beta strand protein
MLPTWLRKLTNPKSLASGRRRGTPAARKPSCRLQLEHLEDRLTPAVHTWIGGDGGYYPDQIWSNPSNWKEGVSPAGDSSADLVFPASPRGSNFATQNDLPGLTIHSITFNNNDFPYTITGNAITLWGDVTDNSPSASIYPWWLNNQPLVNQINLPVTLTTGIFYSHWNVASGSSLLMSGNITGTGNLLANGGTLTLGGSNFYYGGTDITAGTVLPGPNGYLSPNSPVTVEAGATLDLNNQIQIVASLSGAGNVKLGFGTLWTGNQADTTFSGIISGAGGHLNKQGTGTFTLSGPNTYTGGTYVSNGGLLVTQSLAASGSVLVGGGGILGGTGTVGAVTVTSGGQVEPGLNGSGTLSCSSAVFNAGSTFRAHVGARLSATGKIDLSGSPTLLALSNLYWAPLGAPYQILQGGTITGKFGNTVFWNGYDYFSLGNELFLVQYTSTGVVLIRVV